VGSWLALDRMRERDRNGNVIIGKAIPVGTAETVVFNETDDVVALLGVSDMIVVRTGQITFVAHKSRIDQIRSLVEQVGIDHPDLL